MKHIYNPTKAAYIQRSSANATGTAAASKFFMLVLLSFFLLVSGESVGQQAPRIASISPSCVVAGRDVSLTINGTNFKDNNGNPISIRIGNSTDYIKPFEVETDFVRVVIPSNRVTAGDINISVRKTNGSNELFSGPFTIQGVNLTVQSGQSCTPGSVTLTATSSAGGSYRWYRSDNTLILGAVGPIYETEHLTKNTLYYVSKVTSSNCETNRIPVTAVIGKIEPIVTNGYSCSSEELAIMRASGAPTGATYHWYASGANNVQEIATGDSYGVRVGANQTVDYYVTIKAPGGQCESNKVKVTATGGKLGMPGISSNLDCNSKGKEEIRFYATGAGEGQKYRWYKGNTVLANTESTLVVETTGNSELYHVSIAKDDNSCESDKRDFIVPSNGTKLPTAPTSYETTGCIGSSITLAPPVQPGMVFRWYYNDEVVDGLTYTFTPASATSTVQFSTVNVATRCESATRGTVTVNALPQLINKGITGSQVVCQNAQNVTYSVPDLGATYAWTVVAEDDNYIGPLPTLSSSSTREVTINYPNNGFTGRIRVTVSNTCSSYSSSIIVQASNNNAATGTIIEPADLELGKRAVFKFESNVLDSEIVALQWYKREVPSNTWSPVQSINGRDIEFEQMPGNINGLMVDIQVKSTTASAYCITSLGETGSYLTNSFTISNTTIVPLPVELMFFKAQAQTKGVNLIWATASELENKGFEVQVSSNGRDFAAIGFVESRVGTTSLTQHYSFLDTKAVSGTRYYRLKQVDLDGTTSFSPIRAVALDAGSGTASAYPNPFDDAVIVTLTGTEARNVQVVLMDAMGKVLQQRTEETSGNSITVDMRSVTTKGMYVLHVLDSNTRHTFKLMKR